MKPTYQTQTTLLAILSCGLLLGNLAQGAVVAPYAVDSNTLHLWHFDRDDIGSPVNSLDSVTTGAVNVGNQNGATWGNASFSGFDRAGNTSAAANSIIRGATTALRNAQVGAGGGFTYEAIINTTTMSGNQTIFAMDANANANRIHLFRFNNNNLQFFNLLEGATASYSTPIPTDGADAYVANEWFHVAVTYNGNENTADNLRLYWTRVDASRTEANLIGSHQMVNDLSTTAQAVFGIGNDYRTTGSGNTSNLEGSIDEVRLSGIARGADEMLFTIPEPSTALLGALGALALLLRRR
jgi:hypothetical protein